MAAPARTQTSAARSGAVCALVVLGAAWLIVGLLALDSRSRGSLALAVAVAVVLIGAGALLSRGAEA